VDDAAGLQRRERRLVMSEDDFGVWCNDFARRLPDAGRWLRGLPKETRALWFRDIFSGHELCDALDVSIEIMTEGLSKWDHDELPALWIRKLCEVSSRRKREEATQAPKRQNRYQCGLCSDTGYKSHDRLPNTVGYCSCAKGGITRERRWRSGRRIGPG
jgi:hypothetical protein